MKVFFAVLLAVLAVAALGMAVLRTRAWQAYNRRRARKGRSPRPLDHRRLYPGGFIAAGLPAGFLQPGREA